MELLLLWSAVLLSHFSQRVVREHCKHDRRVSISLPKSAVSINRENSRYAYSAASMNGSGVHYTLPVVQFDLKCMRMFQASGSIVVPVEAVVERNMSAYSVT